MADCSSFDDYDRDFQASHQYYRRSPKARADIAKRDVGESVASRRIPP
jgi:hypothetical protein